MDTKPRIFACGVIGFVLLVSGCASTVTITNPDGSVVEMPKDIYAQQQQQQATQSMLASFAEAFKPVDSELSEMGEVADSFRRAMALALMPQIAQSLEQDGYWDYKAAKLQFWGNVIAGPATALLQPFANRLAYGKRGAAYGGGGYTELNFGNRMAKGGGKHKGEGDSAASTSASGDTTFEDFQFSLGNKSPLNIGDGRYLTGKDSQYQQGDGTQGQFLSRPCNPQAPTAAIDCGSTGASGGLSLP